MTRYNLSFVAIEVIILFIAKLLLNQNLHPYFYSFIVSIYASSMMLIFLPKIKKGLNRRSFLITLPGSLFFTLANFSGFIALKLTNLTNYNFLVQSSLLFTPILSAIFLKEKIRWLIFPLIAVNLSGVALLTGQNQWSTRFIGDSLTLLAAMFVSFQFIWQKKAALKLEVEVVAFWTRITSGVLAGIVWLLTPQLGTQSITYGLILLPVAVFYFVFSLVMTKALIAQPLTDFNLFITLSPVLTAVLGYLFLHDQLGSKQWLGSGLIMSSIVVYNWYRKVYDPWRHSRPERVKIS